MVMSLPVCEGCGREAGCTRLDLYVLGGHICIPCRAGDQHREIAVEHYMNAEYEVTRLTHARSYRPDGSPGPKLAEALAARDHHLARVIGEVADAT